MRLRGNELGEIEEEMQSGGERMGADGNELREIGEEMRFGEDEMGGTSI
jgi:hypothetical protein